jgi:hypothetical protein
MFTGPNWSAVNLGCIPFWMGTILNLALISKKEMMQTSSGRSRRESASE